MSNFSSQDEERLKELGELAETWDNLCKVSWHGCLSIHFIWIVYLISLMVSSVGEMFNRVVIGLFLSVFPIMTWVMKALNINPSFTVTNTVLMLTGIAFGLQIVHNFLVGLYERTTDEMDEILDKYRVEVHLVEADSNKFKEE